MSDHEHTPSPEDDPLPAMIAKVDQLAMEAPIVARCARAFFEAFNEAGFNEAQATYLTACQILQDPGSAP